MKQELIGNEVRETNTPKMENYKNIKPEEGGMLKEAKAFFDILFKKEESTPPRYMKTTNYELENKKHPKTGVEFKRKIVENYNGEKIEGVFAEFPSAFDARLPRELYLKTDKEQFKECNRQLAEAIEADPELRQQFSEEQIEQIRDGIKDGTAPDGYVWHHDAEAGKMQLVNFETHARTGHTGGRAIWGGGSDNR